MMALGPNFKNSLNIYVKQIKTSPGGSKYLEATTNIN